MSLESKERLVRAVLEGLLEEVSILEKALSASSAAATDPDSKAESKYDTRSLEMSYLAKGQASQLEELKADCELLEQFEIRSFQVSERVGLGALVELEKDAIWQSYLLLPAGGGLEIQGEEGLVMVLSAKSPLFEELLDSRMGEELPSGAVVSALE